MSSRLTQNELRAINYALSVVLAGELEIEPEDFAYEDIEWREGE
jgi:hypothetical protein